MMAGCPSFRDVPVSHQSSFFGTALPAFIWRWRFVLFALCVVVFCYGYFRPTPAPEFFKDSDKLEHVIAFLGLGLSSMLVTRSWRRAWMPWLLLILAAPLAEGLQHILQPVTRQFSGGDVVGNLIGVLLAAIVWRCVSRWVTCTNNNICTTSHTPGGDLARH
ncbi:hypothetical protein CDEF62S_02666 [Castellaniella defragrans]